MVLSSIHEFRSIKCGQILDPLRKDPQMKLDRIDIKILYELQKNGRITNVELAELVNLSPSPCLMRVKKLQAEGYIVRYSAQIDIAKLGRTLTVFTEITLKNHRQSTRPARAALLGDGLQGSMWL